MTEKTLTTENIKPALDALRGELAPWPVVAKKQDRLNTAQLNAANSGITSSLVAQIIANTAAIRALESAITGTGLRALVVSSLPAIGTQGILYIVPVTTYDPATDADVVNYSNEYIWIVAPDAPVTEGYYEQVGQTGIVINNGQLNITVNGTSVGTFTANQSGDTTAAITVPTNADYVDKTTAQSIAGVKTFSDGIVGNVTGNVTGDLTGTASKAIADEDGTSIKTGYVNVAGNQTVSGDKSFTGSNTFNSILPNATNTYSLGSSSYQWSSVYSQTYYYNGVAWGLDKANEWTGSNKFTGLTVSGVNTIDITQSTLSSATISANLPFKDNNDRYWGAIRTQVQTDRGNILKFTVANWKTNGTPGTSDLCFYYDANLDKKSFYPTSSNVDLGTSTNKWKTLNGINPGALSLPVRDYNSSIALDTTDWVYDGTAFTISMAMPGWVVIVAENVDASDYIKIRLTAYTRSPGLDFGAVNIAGSYSIKACFPIDSIMYLVLKLTNGASCIKYARYYPCLGNV